MTRRPPPGIWRSFAPFPSPPAVRRAGSSLTTGEKNWSRLSRDWEAAFLGPARRDQVAAHANDDHLPFEPGPLCLGQRASPRALPRASPLGGHDLPSPHGCVDSGVATTQCSAVGVAHEEMCPVESGSLRQGRHERPRQAFDRGADHDLGHSGQPQSASGTWATATMMSNSWPRDTAADGPCGGEQRQDRRARAGLASSQQRVGGRSPPS